MYMQMLDAEQCICRIADRYQLDTARVFRQLPLAKQQLGAAAAVRQQ
jgi:hypothetical protein